MLATAGCGHLDMDSANSRAPKGTGFMVKQLTFDGQTRNYGLFVPHDYSTAKPAPVIVFLHGVLQAGSDGVKNMGQGIGPVIAMQPEKYPFIVVFPQSGGDWKGADREKLALAVLDEVQKTYSTDNKRVILTGLSNGGYGVWHIGADHPERFTALVPVAGFSDYDDVPKLTALPIWCFHNSGDFLVPSGGSREMCVRINAAGGHAKYTQLDAVGHDCWVQVYGNPELLTWMMAQKK
jgi:predicted peptidase